MDSVAIIGCIAGLVAAGVGIGAGVWAIGLVEYMGGKKKPSVAPLSLTELKQQLLSLNSPDLPYSIKSVNETDMEIEWKIADARWLAIFGKSRLKKTYRAFLVMDDIRRSVRYCEEIATVKWTTGLNNSFQPSVGYESQFFRGRVLYQKSWETEVGIKEDLSLGKVYEIKFDIGYVRNPIIKIIAAGGWEFVPVLRKKHATYKSLIK